MPRPQFPMSHFKVHKEYFCVGVVKKFNTQIVRHDLCEETVAGLHLSALFCNRGITHHNETSAFNFKFLLGFSVFSRFSVAHLNCVSHVEM